jgi:hypothetical protein
MGDLDCEDLPICDLLGGVIDFLVGVTDRFMIVRGYILKRKRYNVLYIPNRWFLLQTREEPFLIPLDSH